MISLRSIERAQWLLQNFQQNRKVETLRFNRIATCIGQIKSIIYSRHASSIVRNATEFVLTELKSAQLAKAICMSSPQKHKG
jgi:hypothetical protein